MQFFNFQAYDIGKSKISAYAYLRSSGQSCSASLLYIECSNDGRRHIKEALKFSEFLGFVRRRTADKGR
jgi:hypothetical protein